jgi:hypothetical protein
LGIERMLAHSTGGAQIIGTPKADRTEQGDDMGLALSVIDGLVTTRAANAGAGSCGQRAEASNQTGTKLIEEADHVVLEFGQAEVHPS